jgi:hypothetical protein
VRSQEQLKINRMVHINIQKIAEILAPKLRGIIQYYGHFNKTGLKRAMRLVNLRLIKWVINKYRRYRRKPRILAWRWLQNIYKCYPNLFVHWEYGYRP